MNKKLYEFQIRVHLKPEHPKYYEFSFGVLIVWLYATDMESGTNEAIAWIKPLPYERGRGKGFVIADQESFQPYQKSCIASAELMGRNLAFFGYPIGTDENAILGSWPDIIPFLNFPLPD